MTDLEYGSVCSGIEAASQAWHPLGWRPAWFAEIEAFPSVVLAHHYPDVANLGDMTTIAARVLGGSVKAPDVLVGGTPCQAFSVAGLRESLADARGNLTLKYVELADAIDFVRRRNGEDEATIVWENVPGVLSTKDNAFGCFLGALAGAGCELQPPGGGRWQDAGCVYGPKRAIAWRILDAQYFGLAQRRRRVFVVASARNGFDPGEVLFEHEGMRRDTAPRRESRKDIAPTISARTSGGSGLGTDFDLDGGLIPDTARCVTTGEGKRQDWETCTIIPATAHTLRADGFDASEDGTGRGTPLVPVHREIAPTLTGNYGKQPDSSDTSAGPMLIPVAYRTAGDGCVYEEGDRSAPLTTGTDANANVIVFGCKDSYPARGVSDDICPTLRAIGHSGSHANAGGQVAVAIDFRNGSLTEEGPTQTIQAAGLGDERGGNPNAMPGLLTGMAVRRLTPRECERLQGFEDDYTLIPWRGRDADQCPDGPRYKALGNSMAVPVMAWIGRRIEFILMRLAA